MRNTKKFLALVLALVICLGVFAGCQQEPVETTQQPTETTAKPTESNAPNETDPVVLKNADIYPLDSDKTFTVFSGSFDATELDAGKLWEDVTGVDIEWIVWDVPTMQLALASAQTSEDFPDAFAHHSRLNKQQVYEYGTAGVFIDYRDYLDIMPNVKAMFEKYPAALEMVQNEDGSIYTLPMVGNAPSSTPSWQIRTDMLEGAGWTKAPTTTQELLQCLKDIKAKYGADDPAFRAVNGYNSGQLRWDNSSSGCLMWPIFPAFGELLHTDLSVSPDGKEVVLGAATEQFKNALKFMNELWEAELINHDAYNVDATVSRTLAAEGKVASGVVMTGITPDSFADGKLDITILPPLTSEYYSQKHYYPYWEIAWNNMMVSSKCEDIETMCRWIDSFYAPEEDPLNDEGTIWGISFELGELGVDWARDEENMSYDVLPHEGYDSGAEWRGANMFWQSPGHYDFPYIIMDGSITMFKALGVMEKLEPYFEETPYNVAALTLNEEERDIYADCWTGIVNYLMEMTAKFITGEVDIDAEWDNYLEELDVLGLQDVLDVYNAAYQRVKAS